MIEIQISDEEQATLVELLCSSYRQAHREAWEIKVSGNPVYLPDARRRLDLLESILIKAGSSVADAMRPQVGNHPVKVV